eukprot:5721170-Prymnesium_polylepis.1
MRPYGTRHVQTCSAEIRTRALLPVPRSGAVLLGASLPAAHTPSCVRYKHSKANHTAHYQPHPHAHFMSAYAIGASALSCNPSPSDVSSPPMPQP